MIVNFQHKGLKRFFETGNTSGIDSQYAKRISRVLALLATANSIDDMDLPGLQRLTKPIYSFPHGAK